MESRSVDVFINGHLFRTWDIPDNIGLVNIRVYENCPAGTSRQISNEIINPRAKTFTARISRRNTVHIESDKIVWVDGSPYLKER